MYNPLNVITFSDHGNSARPSPPRRRRRCPRRRCHRADMSSAMVPAEADSDLLESALPRGWSSSTHIELDSTYYVHETSRICTWSMPCLMDTDEPEQLTIPEAEGPLASQSVLEEQRAAREASDRRRERDNGRELEQLDPKERLRRELAHRPHERYSSFKHVSKGEGKGAVATRLLQNYCWDVLGARLDFEERREQGSWPYVPPTRTTLRLLGVPVSQGLSSSPGALAWTATNPSPHPPPPRPTTHPTPHSCPAHTRARPAAFHTQASRCGPRRHWCSQAEPRHATPCTHRAHTVHTPCTHRAHIMHTSCTQPCTQSCTQPCACPARARSLEVHRSRGGPVGSLPTAVARRAARHGVRLQPCSHATRGPEAATLQPEVLRACSPRLPPSVSGGRPTWSRTAGSSRRPPTTCR